MKLAAPCRDCGKPYSYLCADCTQRAKGENPVCIHCCPNKEERKRKGNAWSCGLSSNEQLKH